MSHTPGPWRVTDAGYISSPHGFVPFITPFTTEANRDKHRGATPEAMGNARLIAAAPALLEACHAALVELQILREKITPGYPEVKDGLTQLLTSAIAHATAQ